MAGCLEVNSCNVSWIVELTLLVTPPTDETDKVPVGVGGLLDLDGGILSCTPGIPSIRT